MSCSQRRSWGARSRTLAWKSWGCAPQQLGQGSYWVWGQDPSQCVVKSELLGSESHEGPGRRDMRGTATKCLPARRSLGAFWVERLPISCRVCLIQRPGQGLRGCISPVPRTTLGGQSPRLLYLAPQWACEYCGSPLMGKKQAQLTSQGHSQSPAPCPPLRGGNNTLESSPHQAVGSAPIGVCQVLEFRPSCLSWPLAGASELAHSSI